MVKCWVILSLAAVSLFAQTQPAPEKPIDQQRVMGVLPNYRTANPYDVYSPLSSKQKMTIAAKDSFDSPLFIIGGMFALTGQASNADPSYGQGVKGFAQRYAANYGDQMIGNMMSEGVMPVLLHEDPRYFRKVEGSVKSRLWYAATRTFVTHTDRGTLRFNFSEWTGNAFAVAVGQSYHFDDRTAGHAAEKLVLQAGVDSFSNVLKEFWPDVRKHFSKKNPSKN